MYATFYPIPSYKCCLSFKGKWRGHSESAVVAILLIQTNYSHVQTVWLLGYSKILKYELTCSWCTKPTLGLMQNLLSWTWLNASLQSEIGKTWNLCKQQCLYQQLLPVLLSSIFIYYNNYAAVHLCLCNKVSLVLQCAEIVSNTLLWGKNTHLYFIPNVSIRYAITKAALKEQIKVNLVT